LGKQYEAKEKQLEAGRAEDARLVDERISQAIIQNEAKHKQKEKESELQYSRIVSINQELADKVKSLEKVLDNIPSELRERLES
jgi:NTP pyrophosphatase (non-canonical NTP hydrolase)